MHKKLKVGHQPPPPPTVMGLRNFSRFAKNRPRHQWSQYFLVLCFHKKPKKVLLRERKEAYRPPRSKYLLCCSVSGGREGVAQSWLRGTLFLTPVPWGVPQSWLGGGGVIPVMAGGGVSQSCPGLRRRRCLLLPELIFSEFFRTEEWLSHPPPLAQLAPLAQLVFKPTAGEVKQTCYLCINQRDKCMYSVCPCFAFNVYGVNRNLTLWEVLRMNPWSGRFLVAPSQWVFSLWISAIVCLFVDSSGPRCLSTCWVNPAQIWFYTISYLLYLCLHLLVYLSVTCLFLHLHTVDLSSSISWSAYLSAYLLISSSNCPYPYLSTVAQYWHHLVISPSKAMTLVSQPFSYQRCLWTPLWKFIFV